MATATKSFTGFGVLCPHCHDADATVKIDLGTLECSCTACDEEFTAADAVTIAHKQLRAWEAVARWVELAPGAAADAE